MKRFFEEMTMEMIFRDQDDIITTSSDVMTASNQYDNGKGTYDDNSWNDVE
jgi:hypothetical protein